MRRLSSARRAAARLLAQSRLEPCQPAQRTRDLGLLARLARERKRLGVVRLRGIPPVGARLVAGDAMQEVREHADSSVGASDLERALHRVAADPRLTQVQRPHREQRCRLGIVP